MTAAIIFASNKLGVVDDDQMQLMLDKFNLGKLISFQKTVNGAMGQTMHVSSNEGDFILKGNPLYPGQFIEEKFFIENIHKRTNVTVPTPYIIDDSEEIFGWSYSLMPCLQGGHMNSEHLKVTLNTADKLQIAESIAKTLADLHSWKVTRFGELDTNNLNIAAFEGSYRIWLYNRIKFWLEDAKKYSVITDKDLMWVDLLLDGSKEAFDDFTSPSFVVGDFKPGNFLIHPGMNGWEISGLFDFTNSYFGDPISDLIKMITIYLDNGEPELASHLLTVYFNSSEEKEAQKKRIKVHMLHQRVLDWGCAKAMNMVTWDNELPFSHWVESYTDSVASLLD
ncbi:phosphotransferase [Paenibacillus sp. IHB B 3415]|uniref:phosphotransferase family protein n=1 Tax=Paenibacillus sp. IHB B 3415 TaxID=867080 RepID=UPI00057307AF|nr:aminoglycoside phosphotransferase family protein [Paenibacillus sp. IHB B 3415]KHL91965.1 phosphotransferase [Paenibacillus sp. IHB B 3415]